MLLEVKQIFDKISKTSGKNDKIKIIKLNKDNELFVECLKFLLDTDIVTGLSTKKMNKNVRLVENKYEDIREVFDYVIKHNTGTDTDIAIVKSFCKEQGECEEFCVGLFTKKLKIGVDVKGVNKAIPRLIQEFNIMLAESYSKCSERVEGKEFILTTKLDGSRICVIKNNDNIILKTRQNKLYEGLVEIEEDFKHLPNGIYDGELLAIGNFENSAEQYKETMKISRKKGIKHDLKMVCYDYIENIDDFYDGICRVKCIDRKNQLKNILNNIQLQHIEYLEPLYIGKDLDKIVEYSNIATEKGEEGIMLSIANAPYECKRSKNLLKVKQFFEGDVLVTEIVEGTNKYEGKLGCVKCEFLYNGVIQNVEVGSGWSDEERELLFNNPSLILNKVITIKYFEVSQNSTTKQYSLRFPTISMRYPDCVRLDKSSIEDTNIE